MGLNISRILGINNAGAVNSINRINAFATLKENNTAGLGNPNRPVHYNTNPDAGDIVMFDILA